MIKAPHFRNPGLICALTLSFRIMEQRMQLYSPKFWVEQFSHVQLLMFSGTVTTLAGISVETVV
jgi:hypothetical protein